jgi:hypothetical protein
MDITYCNGKCPIGQAARDRFLDENNSAFDAATDFRFFTDNCYKTCPYKSEHIKLENK